MKKSCIIGLSCEILPFISECLEHFSASSRAKLGHSVTMCFSCNFEQFRRVQSRLSFGWDWLIWHLQVVIAYFVLRL